MIFSTLASASLSFTLLSFSCTSATMQDCEVFHNSFQTQEECESAATELALLSPAQASKMTQLVTGDSKERPVLITYCTAQGSEETPTPTTEGKSR